MNATSGWGSKGMIVWIAMVCGLLTACGSASMPAAEGGDVPQEPPQRIAALSLDAAEAVLEMAGSERVVVVPRSAADPALAYRVEEAARVEHQISSAASLDPEEVLSYDPDLIIMTKVHDSERDASALLEQAGIPILSTDAWNTFGEIWANYERIGRAIGAEKEAADIVAEMKSKVEAAEAAVRDIEDQDRSSVIVISPLGPGTGPYVIGPSNIAYEIAKRAGARHAADDLGLAKTTKASMEQIMKADPDYILLIQWREGDNADLEALTEAPGWSALRAVEAGNVKVMTVKELLYPNRYSAGRVEQIARWLYPERFQE